MPYNGSGIYSLPASSAAVAGTTVASAKYNLTISDLESAHNFVRPVAAGGTGVNSIAAFQAAFGIADAGNAATISGPWKFSNELKALNNIKILLGDAGIGQFYSDGTDVFAVADSGGTFRIKSSSGATMARFFTTGGVWLSYQNSDRLKTDANGVEIIGVLSGTAVSSDPDWGNDGDRLADRNVTKAEIAAQVKAAEKVLAVADISASGTLNTNRGVASSSKISTGVYEVTLGSAAPDANYSFSAAHIGGTSITVVLSSGPAPTTTVFRYMCFNSDGVLADAAARISVLS